ncbi:LolA family protein [Halopiger goleimassiliensis]|uniref:LolA family protein n=1 Tax=Halopiger goleimassiliensis TaxID=1293048 RepID=UPI0009DC23B1|nr:outer membrane lipoprotein carrier protein LolA [Halopiger goleimassiliensis]
MPSSLRRPLAVVLVLGTLTMLAGCGLVPSADLSADDLEERLENETPPAELEATVEITETVDGETVERAETVMLRDDGAQRVESAADGQPLVVSDGETRWQVDPVTNESTTVDLDPEAPSLLESIYRQGERYFEAYAVATLQETTFETREVYRIAFEPPANETVERSIDVLVGETEFVIPLETTEREDLERSADRVELWLDQETLFPLRHTIEGDGLTLETTYTDVRFDPGFEDDLFEPPSDQDDGGGFVQPVIEQYPTVADAAEAVPFVIAEPDPATIPDGLVRDGVTVYEFPDEDRAQASVFYRNATTTVSVTTSDAPRAVAVDGEDVEIGGVTGSIARTDAGTELQWLCGDLYYSVFVEDPVDRETAIDVAEGIDCG